MLTRLLFLAASWLILAAVPTMLAGTRLRRGSIRLSLAWLFGVVALGDVWALYAFATPEETAVLSLLVLVAGWWWIRLLPDWNALGQVTWSMMLCTTLLYIIYSFAVTAFTPLQPVAFLIAVIFFFFEMAALVLALTFTFETLDVACRLKWNRPPQPPDPVDGYFPKVSLHVPAYNEPTDVVEATLRTLARLDYPNYEVLLIDNNTPDEATWRPLEAVCRELGPHFHCLHLDDWPGYKSGALNFALAQTAPDSEIVGVVDADYQVQPEYLRELVPAFTDRQIAFVQTPQDYRDYGDNPFLEACYHAYKYFFEITMPSRNERNAAIFGGTMGLIRTSVLREIGGWDEWCITEDAEASLRILKRGYRSLFVNKTYGRGLMPFTFEGLKKQRFRWCFGGIQILKKHWESLMPWASHVDPDNRLTATQRYFYLVGGLQWYNDLLNLVFAAFLVLGGLLLLSPAGVAVRPLAGPLLIIPGLFLILGLWRFLWALRYALNLRLRQAVQAMGLFFSLGWSVALGSIQGLIQPGGVFMRTPKTRSRHGLVRAVRATQWESGLGAACAIGAITLLLLRPQPSTWPLSALLSWQAGLYLSAPYFSLLSIRGRPLLPPISRADILGREVAESRAARWAVTLTVLLIAGALTLWATPPPSEPPAYARLEPAKIPAGQFLGLGRVPIRERDPESILTATPAATEVVPASDTATPTTAPSTPTAEPTAPGIVASPTTAPVPPPSPTPTSPPPGPTQTGVPPSATPQPSQTPQPTAPPTTPAPTQTGVPPTATPQPTASFTVPAPTQTGVPPSATPQPTASFTVPAPTDPAPTQPVPTSTTQPPTEPAPTQVPTQPASATPPASPGPP